MEMRAKTVAAWRCCKCRKKIESGTECWNRADGKGKRRVPLCVKCDKDAADGFARGRSKNDGLFRHPAGMPQRRFSKEEMS